MPSWDRPSKGSGDNDGDKPPAPKVPYHEPYVPEGTRASADPPGDAGDRPRRPGDTSRETGNGTDKDTDPGGYEALFEYQATLIGSQERRIGSLAEDLGKRDAEIARLKEEIEGYAEVIDRLASGGQGPDAGDETDGPDYPNSLDGPHDGDNQGDAVDKHTEWLERTVQRQERMIERQDRMISKLDDDNNRLRARISDLEGEEGGSPSEAIARKEFGDAGQVDAQQKPPWHKRLHMPGDKATKAIAGAAGTAEAVALATHAITTTEGAIGMAAGGFIWATVSWGREKHGKRQERKRNADQSEG